MDSGLPMNLSLRGTRAIEDRMEASSYPQHLVQSVSPWGLRHLGLGKQSGCGPPVTWHFPSRSQAPRRRKGSYIFILQKAIVFCIKHLLFREAFSPGLRNPTTMCSPRRLRSRTASKFSGLCRLPCLFPLLDESLHLSTCPLTYAFGSYLFNVPGAFPALGQLPVRQWAGRHWM